MLVVGFAFWLVPPVALALTGGRGGLGAAAAAGTGLSALFWMLIALGMRIPPWYGLLYPLGALTALGIGARSTWRGGRKVEWRGRAYTPPASVPVHLHVLLRYRAAQHATVGIRRPNSTSPMASASESAPGVRSHSPSDHRPD